MWLTNIVELACPLKPGDKIADALGEFVRIYEVSRLASLSTEIAGERRPLYAVLHAGAGSVLVAVCLDGDQQSWSSSPRPSQAERGPCLKCGHPLRKICAICHRNVEPYEGIEATHRGDG